jgi:hypothetical protein
VRTPDITEEDLLPIWVGTEQNITFRGGSPRVESEVEGPFDEEEEGGAERIREMIRRRIQNLPRGLREGQEEEGEAPAGENLVPGATAPTDVFRPAPQNNDDEDDEPFASAMELLPPDIRSSIVSSEDLESSLGRLSSLTVDESGDEPAGETVGEWLPQPVLVVAAADPASALESAAPQSSSTTAAKAAAVELSLEPAKRTVNAGSEFEISLVIDTSKKVSHLPITLSYDSDVIELIGVTKGTFLGSEEECEVLADFSEPGKVVLGASRLGEVEGVQGQGVVAVLEFRALEVGSAKISFDSRKALNKNLKLVKGVKSKAGNVDVVAGGLSGS